MKVKKIVVGIFTGGVFLLSQSCQKSSAPTSSPSVDNAAAAITSDIDKVSYGIGQQLGQNFKTQGLTEINLPVLVSGIGDAFSGKENPLTEEVIQAAMVKVQEEAQKKLAEQGAKFLSENGKKEGVVTTASGLQYKIVTEGEGDAPKPEAIVKVHYTGTFIDGTVFDSSHKRGEPVEFPVKAVIPGWTEALQLMKPGSKWELVIPSELGYGSRPTQGIPANSVLKFTVELLEVKPENASK